MTSSSTRSCEVSATTMATVGPPPSAANRAAHRPSLQAQKRRESGTVTASVWHGKSMTNRSRSFNEPRRKRCQKRQKAPSGVSYSQLNTHRLVNWLEGYRDETGLC